MPGRLAAAVLAALLLGSCTTPPAPTEPSFTGTWTGALPIGPTDTRAFTLQLHERADLSLVGYLMGGTSYRALAGGQRVGDDAILVFELSDSALTRSIVVSGTVAGGTLTATALEGGVSTPVNWTRTAAALDERNFIFVESIGGGSEMMQLSVVLDGSGALVSGGFVGGDCALIACGGGVTSFSETPAGDLSIGIETGGGCSGTGTITATFDPTDSFYTGTWDYADDGGCGGAMSSGPILGGRAMGTTSTHAAQVLGHLGQLADDLEAGATFAAPYAPIAPSYLHFGETDAMFLAARNAEVAAHPAAQVEISDVKTITTVEPVGRNPFLPDATVVEFADRRSDASGVYRQVDARTPAAGGYKFLGDDGGVWRIIGNQVGEFDLPFPYAIGTERLVVPAGSGPTAGSLHLSLGGWGAHFGPLTGHREGNGKADMFAQYAPPVDPALPLDHLDPADRMAGALMELVADPAGTPQVCDVPLVRAGSEVCGFYGGPGGSIITDRMFRYFAPYDGVVEEVSYEERPRPAGMPETHYFGNPPHWTVTVAFEGGLRIRFGHLSHLTGAVRAGFMAATGTDPDAYAPPATPDCPLVVATPVRCDLVVLDEADAFPIVAGDEIAIAQTDAAEIAGFPGFFETQIGPSLSPWGQVEFFVSEEAPADQDPNVCAYQYLPAAKQTAMAAAMTADMLNPASLRYAPDNFARPWKYRAEGALCNGDGYFFRDQDDFSSIHAQLGGWYEAAGAGVTPDEIFAIVPISKDAAPYDPSLFDVKLGTAEPTDYLIARDRSDGGPFSWTLPVGGATNIFYPAGEALELTDTSFVVKWRELDANPVAGDLGEIAYQRAAYELDPSTGLKVKWGPLSATLVGATAPVLAPGEPCDDATVLCYNRTRH